MDEDIKSKVVELGKMLRAAGTKPQLEVNQHTLLKYMQTYGELPQGIRLVDPNDNDVTEEFMAEAEKENE